MLGLVGSVCTVWLAGPRVSSAFLSSWSVFLQLVCDYVTRMFGAIDIYVLDKTFPQAGCQMKKKSA